MTISSTERLVSREDFAPAQIFAHGAQQFSVHYKKSPSPKIQESHFALRKRHIFVLYHDAMQRW
jgi:hypothetical protein